MHAYFDLKDGDPKVVIEIKGTKKNFKKQIVALFDTGHNGSLSLPVLDLIDIGAKLSSVGVTTLADGYKKPQLYFSVKIIIDGVEKEVEASLIENPEENEAIAGLQLFSPYIALIDFKKRVLRFVKAEDLKG
jgi:predicted aspartyl protease